MYHETQGPASSDDDPMSFIGKRVLLYARNEDAPFPFAHGVLDCTVVGVETEAVLVDPVNPSHRCVLVYRHALLGMELVG